MRYTELITEAGLGPAVLQKDRAKYLISIINIIASGQALETTEGAQLQFPKSLAAQLSLAAFGEKTPPDPSTFDVDKTGKLEANDPTVLLALLKKMKTVTGDVVSSGKIFKSTKVKGGGAGTTTKGFNAGNVGEGILGAAVTAAFKERKQGTVTEKLILNVLTELSDPKILTKNAVLGITDIKSANDNIHFKLGLGRGDYIFLIKSAQTGKLHPEVLGMVRSAMKYANESPQIGKAIKYIVADKNKNQVTVNSDGVSNNTGTKADLFLDIDGKTIRLLSLKTGDVKQYGQGSGHSLEAMTGFFQSALGINIPKNIASMFVDDQERVEVRNKIVGPMYKTIVQQLQKELSTDAGEANFIKRLYKGILHHATGNDPDVSMVILKKTPNKVDYTELRFGPELLETLKQYKIHVVQEKDNYIKIFGVPIGTEAKKLAGKQLLVQLRSGILGGTMRNMVEMGGLLKSITKVENEIIKNNS